MSGSLKAFLALIRVERSLSAAFGVLFAGFFVGDLKGFQLEYVLAWFVVFLAAIANFGLNDFCDLEVDRLNNREDRPLAEGLLSERFVITTIGVSTLLALLLSLFLRPMARFLILAGLPISLIYNLLLKKIFLIKNATVASVNVGIVLLGSIVVDGSLETMALYIAVVGFFVGLSYEIMLDIADVEGDGIKGIMSLPVKLGKKRAAWISILLGLGALVVDPLPFFVKIDTRLYRDPIFLLAMLIPIALRLDIIKSLYTDQSNNNIFSLKKKVFRNIQLGCACFLLGILV